MIFTLFVLAETAITVSHVPSRAPLLPALCPALAATAIAIRMAGAGADACARMTGAVAYTANGEASRDSTTSPIRPTFSVKLPCRVPSWLSSAEEEEEEEEEEESPARWAPPSSSTDDGGGGGALGRGCRRKAKSSRVSSRTRGAGGLDGGGGGAGGGGGGGAGGTGGNGGGRGEGGSIVRPNSASAAASAASAAAFLRLSSAFQRDSKVGGESTWRAQALPPSAS